MNRRSFLQILGLAGVATVVAPKVVIDRVLAPPVVGPTAIPLTEAFAPGLQTMLISFPDGVTYELQGYITSQLVGGAIDGVVENTVSFQPSGPCKIIEGLPTKRPVIHSALPADGVRVQCNGHDVGAITELEMPAMTRTMYEVTSDGTFDGSADGDVVMIPGLRRMSELTFTIAGPEGLLPQ